MTRLQIIAAIALAVAFPTQSTAEEKTEQKKSEVRTLEVDGGKYRIKIDSSETPDLNDWIENQLTPMIQKWYPKLVEMLPSEGFEAPKDVTINFDKDMKGVAAASGTRINCSGEWMKNNLKGEATGAVFHELVHVVQQYGWGRRNNPDAHRNPGWVVEGIPDYIRWFIYEPQTKGAEITARNIARAKYDGNYRISANFINWVVNKYDKDLVRKLNAAARAGKYSEDLWKDYTGKPLEELGAEWKKEHEKRLGIENSSTEKN